MEKTVKIFAFAGSLREQSFNKALLRAARELLPEGAEMEIFDLEGLPPFNQDLEQTPPARWGPPGPSITFASASSAWTSAPSISRKSW